MTSCTRWLHHCPVRFGTFQVFVALLALYGLAVTSFVVSVVRDAINRAVLGPASARVAATALRPPPRNGGGAGARPHEA